MGSDVASASFVVSSSVESLGCGEGGGASLSGVSVAGGWLLMLSPFPSSVSLGVEFGASRGVVEGVVVSASDSAKLASCEAAAVGEP